MAPYRGQTYHLQQFRGRQRGLSSSREVFNYTHSSLRNCIERTFGVWKARFPILKRITNYPLNRQIMIPIACAVLHNFIRGGKEHDELLLAYNRDGVSIEEINPVDNENHRDEDNDDDNDVVEDNNNIGINNDTQNMQYDDNYELGVNMIAFRQHISDDMWEGYRQAPWY